ncbi:MAG TPA: plasmid pRiA4b ORF-3 family protein [Micromonosporaceae bacterium]|nr:plasmid pRiA4b ORF-3 family protein [Micromonosporaceae bacterium]
MSRQIYQLLITLADVAPPVWRRVLVPGGYTLDRVHRTIQYAMGWQNCRLHSFEIDGEQYGEPDPDGELALRDELDARLDAVAGKGDCFTYTYDFGDWWEHHVAVEDVFPADAGQAYPVCREGERACPPEGIGGPDGYAQLLEALADPAHPDHAATQEWLGRRYDPDAFVPQAVSVLLRRMV